MAAEGEAVQRRKMQEVIYGDLKQKHCRMQTCS